MSSFLLLISCSKATNPKPHPDLTYESYKPKDTDKVVNREEYYNKLQGFWLGTCIGNWTGLVTEMDKTGNIGEEKTGNFYTRDDWGQPDQPGIWGEDIPGELSPTIDFVFADVNSIGGAEMMTQISNIFIRSCY